jgi:hypothetical protein
MLQTAVRICEAKLYLREGDAFRTVAMHNTPQASEQRERNPLVPDPLRDWSSRWLPVQRPSSARQRSAKLPSG